MAGWLGVQSPRASPLACVGPSIRKPEPPSSSSVPTRSAQAPWATVSLMRGRAPDVTTHVESSRPLPQAEHQRRCGAASMRRRTGSDRLSASASRVVRSATATNGSAQPDRPPWARLRVRRRRARARSGRAAEGCDDDQVKPRGGELEHLDRLAELAAVLVGSARGVQRPIYLRPIRATAAA